MKNRQPGPKCEICGKQMKNVQGLSGHMQLAHGKTTFGGTMTEKMYGKKAIVDYLNGVLDRVNGCQAHNSPRDPRNDSYWDGYRDAIKGFLSSFEEKQYETKGEEQIMGFVRRLCESMLVGIDGALAETLGIAKSNPDDAETKKTSASYIEGLLITKRFFEGVLTGMADTHKGDPQRS